MNNTIRFVEDAGELRFPDEDGPWTIRCYVRLPAEPLDPPRFGFALQLGTDRFAHNEEFPIGMDGVVDSSRYGEAFVRLHLKMSEQGLDPQWTLRTDDLKAMMALANRACAMTWIEVLAKKLAPLVPAEDVARVWRLEEVRSVMTL